MSSCKITKSLRKSPKATKVHTMHLPKLTLIINNALTNQNLVRTVCTDITTMVDWLEKINFHFSVRKTDCIML